MRSQDLCTQIESPQVEPDEAVLLVGRRVLKASKREYV